MLCNLDLESRSRSRWINQVSDPDPKSRIPMCRDSNCSRIKQGLRSSLDVKVNLDLDSLVIKKGWVV